MYLTFDEYTELGGTIDNENEFNSIAYEAQYQIDYATFNRLVNDTEVQDAVKKCMFELIRLVNIKRGTMTVSTSSDTSTTASVTSTTNDGVKIDYNVASPTEIFKKYSTEVKSLISMYLYNTKNELGQYVLYRGRYYNE